MQPPIFVIGPPQSGADILADALARASGMARANEVHGTFLETLPELAARLAERQSDVLTEQDAEELADDARAALSQAMAEDQGDRRPVAAGARLALRVGFLAAVFPHSRFVFVTADPRETLPAMLTVWRSGQATHPTRLEGWEGPDWALPLVPTWRQLNGLPLPAIVAEQWCAITELALNDLERLEPQRWAVCQLHELLEDPRRELRRLCTSLEARYDQALLDPPEAARRARTLSPPPAPTPELEGELHRTASTEQRLRDLIAAPSRQPPPPRQEEDSPFRSVFTGTFAQILRRLNASLLISTYQAGRLVVARDTGTLLNTHFRQFDKPMGIAVADGRIALGTRAEIFDFRNMREVAPKVEPAGTHDACYLPRNRHLTGEILIHELAYAGGELWGVATAFSCLATFDADHSFVPRWAPQFISELQPGDRCHLNGLAIAGDRPAFVTALGQSDEPGGWRAGKANGGCVISVDTKEVVLTGLSMPHSPRWHDSRLWLLESGRGALVTVDLNTGRAETVAELPGFTRGLAIAGDLAFVGLSQIRESSTFGDLPLTERLEERASGVWVVNLRSGSVMAFLRFEDLVQEVFEVALLPGVRYPEIAEPGSSAALQSFQLP